MATLAIVGLLALPQRRSLESLMSKHMSKRRPASVVRPRSVTGVRINQQGYQLASRGRTPGDLAKLGVTCLLVAAAWDFFRR